MTEEFEDMIEEVEDEAVEESQSSADPINGEEVVEEDELIVTDEMLDTIADTAIAALQDILQYFNHHINITNRRNMMQRRPARMQNGCRHQRQGRIFGTLKCDTSVQRCSTCYFKVFHPNPSAYSIWKLLL